LYLIAANKPAKPSPNIVNSMGRGAEVQVGFWVTVSVAVSSGAVVEVAIVAGVVNSVGMGEAEIVTAGDVTGGVVATTSATNVIVRGPVLTLLSLP
jgi:hypothetical protein